MQPNDQPSFPFFLLVAAPLPLAGVALVGTIASALGKSVAVYTIFGAVIIILVCITGLFALAAEFYALPIAVNVLARHRTARTLRNVVAAVYAGAFLVGSLAYLAFGLRHG